MAVSRLHSQFLKRGMSLIPVSLVGRIFRRYLSQRAVQLLGVEGEAHVGAAAVVFGFVAASAWELILRWS
jgi:hypothetical protein